MSEITLSPVSTCRRTEVDWLCRGAGSFFPEQYERFLAAAAREPGDDEGVFAVYARLMEDPDEAVREERRPSGAPWEDAVLSWETNYAFNPYQDHPPAYRAALARMRTHYYARGASLEEGVLLREAERLAGSPGILIHGRRDLTWPPQTAWKLSRAWPGAELIIVEDGRHLGTDAKRDYVLQSIDRYAPGG